MSPMASSSTTKRALLLLLAVLLQGCPCSAAAPAAHGGRAGGRSPAMEERFRRWKVEYNRSYATAAEERRRFRVYARNVAYIEATNAEAAAAGLTYELGETAFTDLTNQEFAAMYTAPPPLHADGDDEDAPAVITTRAGLVDAGRQLLPPYANLSDGAPASVDWRASGAVTPVKNQGRCGTTYHLSFQPGIV